MVEVFWKSGKISFNLKNQTSIPFSKFLLDITNDPRREEIVTANSGMDATDREELEGKIMRYREEQQKYAAKEKAHERSLNHVRKIKDAVASGKDLSGKL